LRQIDFYKKNNELSSTEEGGGSANLFLGHQWPCRCEYSIQSTCGGPIYFLTKIGRKIKGPFLTFDPGRISCTQFSSAILIIKGLYLKTGCSLFGLDQHLTSIILETENMRAKKSVFSLYTTGRARGTAPYGSY
jgi:hypothetical protein